MSPRAPLFALLSVIGSSATSTAQSYDVVVRGGTLVDGTGAPAVRGDIAIREGRIAAVGRIGERGRTEIDATSLVVAPGFIDVHTHSEDITDLPFAENFLRMGVTTLVTGNCGSSKVNVAEFFEQIERTQVAVNVATLLGQGSVRGQVMGGSFMRPPNAAETERMRELVAQAMKDGALGLSTGLIYLPGTFAKTEELIELARVASTYGGLYVSHLRAETIQIFDALDELTRIAREAKIRAQVSHLKLSRPSAWGRADEVIAVLAHARAKGLEIAHDQYLYTASSTNISSLVPDSAREGGNVQFRSRLQDPEKKAAIIREMKHTLTVEQNADYTYAVIADYKRNPALNGKTIPEAAQVLRGAATLDDQVETILAITAEGGAQGVFHSISEADLRKFLLLPETMIASDAGPRDFGKAVPHPRGYGNNARLLGRYVRELNLLTLEEAVRKMTSLPAQTFRLAGRGELRPGAVADVVVFDPATVADPSTFSDPHHYAVGFSEVLVNGVPVIRTGKLTGARPGRPVKRGE